MFSLSKGYSLFFDAWVSVFVVVISFRIVFSILHGSHYPVRFFSFFGIKWMPGPQIISLLFL